MGDADDKLGEAMAALGDDSQLIQKLKLVYDCAQLRDVLSDNNSISAAKVQVYEQHKHDLCALKHIVRKYLSKEEYDALFNGVGENSYAAYSGIAQRIKRAA